MKTEDPWKNLTPASSSTAFNARRVDPALPWDFFWARDVDRRCLLLLRHAPGASPTGRLPRLKGIDVVTTEGEDDGKQTLILRLLEPAHRDIFHRLCLDVMAPTINAKTEDEALALTLTRTWRWHHLLRGGRDGRLSSEEQKGLIGELLVLERLFQTLSVLAAVSAWRGPMGSPKDFEIGRLCIEAKARRGAATPYVLINSEHQLDTAGVDILFLYVAELDTAQPDTTDAFSLADMISRLAVLVGRADPLALDIFLSLLLAAGYDRSDDYSDINWVAGPHHIYQVHANFPSIVAASLPSGVTNVKYSLSLLECEPFFVSDDTLSSHLQGDKYAD